MVKSTALPSGSTCGRRWLSSPFAGFGCRQHLRSAACVGDLPQATATVVREDDSTVRPPTDTRRERRATERHHRTSARAGPSSARRAARVGRAVAASLPEADPLPIGREEWALRPLRSLDRHRVQSIHRPHIQLPHRRRRCGSARHWWPRCFPGRLAAAPTKTSDWPSGDNAMADRNGRALGKLQRARDLARRRHANEHTRDGAGRSCRARLQTASAETAAATTMANATASTDRQFTFRAIAAGVATSVGAARASSIAIRRLRCVLPAAARLLVQTMPQQRAYPRWDG